MFRKLALRKPAIVLPPDASARREPSVSQGAVKFPAGGLGWTLRRVNRVLHFLPNFIEALASLLGWALLMAGSQTRQRQGASGNQQRDTHQSLLNGYANRNVVPYQWLHHRSSILVGEA